MAVFYAGMIFFLQLHFEATFSATELNTNKLEVTSMKDLD